MKKYYPLLIKAAGKPLSIKYYDSYSHALQGIKDELVLMEEKLKLKVKLNYVRGKYSKLPKNKIPSPRYRESVYQFWMEFLAQGTIPSNFDIDYSDYKFSAVDEDIDEYDFDDPYDWHETIYGAYEGLFPFEMGENQLGFSFLKSSCGAIIAFQRHSVLSYTIGGEEDNFLFNLHFEKIALGKPLNLDFCILPAASKVYPAKTATSLMILDALLCGEWVSAEDIIDIVQNRYCVTPIMFFDKIPALNGTTSPKTVFRCIEALRELGYDIQFDPDKRNFFRIGDPEPLKKGLVPISKKPKKEEDEEEDDWEPSLYPVIIYNTLLQCDKPIPIFTKHEDKDSLQKMIKRLYGCEIDRKAISRHITTMQLMGYKISQTDKNVFLEKNK